MGYEHIRIEKATATAIVSICRPDKLNALNRDTVAELHGAFLGLRDDGEIRCVILTGGEAKRPAFVAGADIAEMANLTPDAAHKLSRNGQALCDLIERLGKPVIGAVNGFALGGGLELALACHFRLGSTDALMGLPEVTLGIIPGYGGTQRLPRIVGCGAALEMILSGAPIDAARALALGLLNAVYPPDELMPAARKLADKIAGNGPIAVRMALECTLEARMELEAQRFGEIFNTRDLREGLGAFVEKRKPEYRGE